MIEQRFSLDTSALINPWRKMWPLDLIPTFWTGIAAMNADGRVVLSEEVLRELEHKDDELHRWAKANLCTWHPVSVEVQECVREIMARWGRLVDQRPGHGSADPFVIATARVTGAIVVTDESPVATEQKPKIPFVCNELGVECIAPLEFVRRTAIVGPTPAG
jgi:hypothetical protein